jgi:thioredoxin-related protein
MRRKISIAIVFILSTMTVVAQEQGIRFEKDLNWEQVLQKAKTEHKYIFVDCYATWCGTCKWMDANVYDHKDVGDRYNAQFISVRAQMDQTAHDDSLIKNWYGIAYMLANDYSVNAYPTFLFFDDNGTPVHKAAGRMNAKEFNQMAADAHDPQKQYYAILKDFQPGKLDTAEEKRLARSFHDADKELGGKLASDYLARIPQSQLAYPDNGRFMIEFQNNPDVLAEAISYVHQHGLDNNRVFVEQLCRQPAAMQMAIDSIRKFNDAELGQAVNLRFIAALSRDPAVEAIARKFIDRLPDDSLYTQNIIPFLAVFTQTPVDRGFDVFYTHTARVDTVMKDKYYAEDLAFRIVNKAEFIPQLIKARETGTAPDFDSILDVVKQKYNADYAKKVIINGKVNWYRYLVNDKHETRYWPELIKDMIIQVNKMYDMETDSRAINNIAYAYIFLHSDDAKQIAAATEWMKKISEKHKTPENADTYACLLYKSENLNMAIAEERKALQLATEKKDKELTTLFSGTIEKMLRGEKLWLEKEYMDN